VKSEGGSVAGRYIPWLTIRDLAGSVVEDVRRIREHPLVPRSIPIHGFIYDVRTGKLLEVEAARPAGRVA
jgi:carbonic anhydrase